MLCSTSIAGESSTVNPIGSKDNSTLPGLQNNGLLDDEDACGQPPVQDRCIKEVGI